MKNPLPYDVALNIAQAFLADTSGGYDRAEIAGSLRRKKEMVGDIEIVCIPKMGEPNFDLFGDPAPARSLLDDYLCGYTILKGDQKYKKIALHSIDLDLFITSPDCWGSVFTIRTGSADFSKWLVTHRQQGGACPGYLRFQDGRLIHNNGQLLETPEERDVFTALRLDWIAPEKRVEGGWK